MCPEPSEPKLIKQPDVEHISRDVDLVTRQTSNPAVEFNLGEFEHVADLGTRLAAMLDVDRRRSQGIEV
jgi:hypothetical protein